METVGFFKVYPDAVIPVKGTPESVGWDLFSNVDCTILPGTTHVVSTGIGVVIPKKCYGRIAPRSGWSLKSLIVNGGAIDPDYRNEMGIILFNASKEPITINKGYRVAQFILERVSYQNMPEIRNPNISPSEAESSQKSHEGFGSTGL